MKPTTIFITYNPHNWNEQTMAARLHTIGAASGFRMYLPERSNGNQHVELETVRRINESDYFIIFSFGALSNVVNTEIDIAFNHFNDKSKIIVIYDAFKGKTLGGGAEHFIPFYFNSQVDHLDTFLKSVIEQISTKKEDNVGKTILALIGIGLGFLILNEIGNKN